MHKHENYLKLLVCIGAMAAVIQFVISGITGISGAVRLVSTSISVALAFHWLFKSFLWKLRIFRSSIVRVPNLQGTWEGKILPVGSQDSDIETKVLIRQTFTTISVEFLTENMTSNSYIAGFCINEESGNIELCYSYISKSKISQRETNPWHEGSCKLKVNEYSNGITLEGEYWTSRKSIGSIKITKTS